MGKDEEKAIKDLMFSCYLLCLRKPCRECILFSEPDCLYYLTKEARDGKASPAEVFHKVSAAIRNNPKDVPQEYRDTILIMMDRLEGIFLPPLN